MFHESDPRRVLAVAATQPRDLEDSYQSADYVPFHHTQPAEADASAHTWYARGQNFIVSYTETVAPATLTRLNHPDEYMVLVPDQGMKIRASVDDAVVDVNGHHLIVIPPGASTITALTAGRIVRIFTSRSEDLAARCVNAASYATPHRCVAPLRFWPDPPGGFRVRAYDLNVPARASRFGRLFRCTGLLVNVLYPWLGPRDATRLSPHHHEDFEQGALGLSGEFVQHHRWLWTPNRSAWREDEHLAFTSPALVVIPPPAVHTTEAVGKGINQMVDIFSPPRLDFSLQPDWVLNADDYPVPQDGAMQS